MSSILHRYKSAERLVYKNVAAAASRGIRRVFAAWSRFINGGSQCVSILVISHTEEPPHGIRISLFGLTGLAMLVMAVIVLGFAFSESLGGARAKVSASSVELNQAQDELEAIKAQTGRLASAYQDFQAALGPIIVSGGSHDANPTFQEAGRSSSIPQALVRGSVLRRNSK